MAGTRTPSRLPATTGGCRWSYQPPGVVVGEEDGGVVPLRALHQGIQDRPHEGLPGGGTRRLLGVTPRAADVGDGG